jgi:hypothetical protein
MLSVYIHPFLCPFFLKGLYCSDSLYKINMYNCSLHQLLTVVCTGIMRW